VRTGNQWRFMPGDLPPWTAVYQQTQRWMRAGVFEILVEDVRSLLREFAGRKPQPTAMIVDSRTLLSTPESGARAGYDGTKRRKGSKVHAAVDTLGHLLALHVTAASEQDRAQVERLAAEVQQITGRSVELAYVDQGIQVAGITEDRKGPLFRTTRSIGRADRQCPAPVRCLADDSSTGACSRDQDRDRLPHLPGD
jgi:transposase